MSSFESEGQQITDNLLAAIAIRAQKADYLRALAEFGKGTELHREATSQLAKMDETIASLQSDLTRHRMG